MSFSKEVKTELAHTTIGEHCCRRAEIMAFMLLRGELTGSIGSGWKMEITSDHPAVARRVYRIFKLEDQKKPQVLMINRKKVQGYSGFKVNSYLREELFQDAMTLVLRTDEGDFLPELYEVFAKPCCQAALFRTAFICRGFVTPPENSYHLEMLFPNADFADFISRKLKENGIENKVIQRKKAYQLYMKDSERICRFLTLIGAKQAAENYVSLKKIRSAKNTVNRQTNFESANMEKTVQAAARQAYLIRKFAERFGLRALPANYRELAQLRLDYEELNLQELGTMLTPPLSKSGVAYRMRRIESIAKEMLAEKY